ncbi:MAG: nucleoside recognition domain-containing protein [Bacillota bacterium]
MPVARTESAKLQLIISTYKGILDACSLVFTISVYLVPSMIVMQALTRFGIIHHVGTWMSPWMVLFGLPGEASLALLTGYVVSPTAGLSMALALGPSLKQMAILGTMLGICHSAVLEIPVARRAGAPVGVFIGTRLLGSLTTGLVLNLLLV